MTQTKELLRNKIVSVLPVKFLQQVSGISNPDRAQRAYLEAAVLAHWDDGETKASILKYLETHT